MTLSAAAIADFKEIYTKQFGEHLSDSEAEQKGLAVIKLLRLIYLESAPAAWRKRYGKAR